MPAVSLPFFDFTLFGSLVNYSNERLRRVHNGIVSTSQKMVDATVLFSKHWKEKAITTYHSLTDISDWKIVVFALQHFGKRITRSIQEFVLEPRDWQGWIQNTTQKIENFVALYL